MIDDTSGNYGKESLWCDVGSVGLRHFFIGGQSAGGVSLSDKQPSQDIVCAMKLMG